MYGVLVDVSRSMQSVYSVDDSRDTTVRRSHAIFKTVLNIVNNESNNQDEIFVGAFGVKVRSVTTCDLLALLNKANKVPQELQGLKPGVEAMVKLANREGYGGTVDWIRKNLSEDDAKDLFRLMCIKPSIKKQLLEKLPSNTRATAARYAFKFQKYAASVVQSTTDYDEREREVVRKSDAFQCAKELVKRKSIIMEEMLLEIQTPIPQHTSAVVELFQEMKLDEDDPRSGSSESVRKKIDETLESIEPYIYGATPMVKAMRDTLRIFRKFKRDNPGKQMALLILTDGESTDGNPKIIADQLKKLGVTIVTCFLTNEHLDNPYKCYDDSEKSSPLCPVLLEMSSTKHNNDSPMYYLADAGWKLPLSGESRLYIEANTLEIVNEVCEKVISELNRPCRDGVTDILTAVGVQNLVGQSLDKFKPGDQDEKKTCYAHAVAAVICFALHRIVDRDGGYPEFETVCEELIHEFGEQGAHVSQVLSEVCPRHRLRYTDVNEIKARAALSRRRPLVATFKYTMKQREQLIEFYEYNSCGILHKENLEADDPSTVISHAVVLIKAYPNCLMFANSWGDSFGDKGFFKIKDSSVFSNMTFFDIYWDEDNLSIDENERYKLAANKRLLEWAEEYKSLKDLPFQCPNCKEEYKMSEFGGNYEEAICPNEQCNNRTFQPNYQDLGKTLYLRDCQKQ